ncbi:potassium channel subfamily K member 18-like [Daphnia carinata]|uniref:potassium channel subfamily K member 18-like n=1 Tax=Daphnia carinata TaxID=120202 RepID=UPI002579795C|nr:potassium channel subfamily K member 18-like [Daphnia carinata]
MSENRGHHHRSMSVRDRDHHVIHHHRDPRLRRGYLPPAGPDPDSWFYKLKEFARKLIAFLFGHVGICGLVVGYIIMGAFAFMAIESEDQKRRYEDVVKVREATIRNLWNITHELNVLYPSEWNESVSIQVQLFQQKIVQFVMEGYDGKNYVNQTRSQQNGATHHGEADAGTTGAWSFSASFLYCLTVITTIGYGNIAPRTVMGKMVTIVYAMVGMPLFLLYVSNMGDFLATCFRWGYVKLCKCSCFSRPVSHHGAQRGARRRISQRSGPGRQDLIQQQQQYDHMASIHQRRIGGAEYDLELQPGAPYDAIHHVVSVHPAQQQAAQPDYTTATVPITISLTVMVTYVVGGAVLFQQWETDWDYLDGSYFCFISLSTTGFGDLVPGEKINSSSGVELSLIFCSMYLIIGMALIAMCFNLMQEEVIAKVRKFGQLLGCIKAGEE